MGNPPTTIMQMLTIKTHSTKEVKTHSTMYSAAVTILRDNQYYTRTNYLISIERYDARDMPQRW